MKFAYYHCSYCGHGYQPWRESLRLDKGALTPAAEELSSLAGVLGSFADDAERVLRKMSGLHLSESTVERTTEAAGERLAERLEAGQASALRLCQRGRHGRASTRARRCVCGWRHWT